MSSRDAISPRGSSPSSRAALDARPLPRPQILLVDDDEGLLDTLGAFLRLTGYSVVTVRTYDLAVEHLRSYRPDILITDLQLGDADGWHLAYEARRDQPLLSVVVVTAWLYLSDLAPGGPGIPVFIKPFDPEELLRYLQSIC